MKGSLKELNTLANPNPSTQRHHLYRIITISDLKSVDARGIYFNEMGRWGGKEEMGVREVKLWDAGEARRS